MRLIRRYKATGRSFCLYLFRGFQMKKREMGIVELFLIAVGLSMDAFAVAVCKGLAMKK